MNKYPVRFIAYLILSLTLLPGIFAVGNPESLETAHQGVFDLSNWDFRENPTVKLNGEWMFFWEDFVDPLSEKSVDSYLILPGVLGWGHR